MRHVSRPASRLAPWRAATASVLVALALAGCASDRNMTTGSVNRDAAAGATSVEALGQAYSRDAKNKSLSMRYAAALQANGRADQSLAVMRKTAIDFPRDRDVLAAYGKALAAAGQLEPALDAVRRAQTPEYPDWRLMSAEAAILDQLGQSDNARQLYRRALEQAPGEPTILSNLGMSYVLEGDLRAAETYMRQAAQAPAADSRVRQNLASSSVSRAASRKRSRSPARSFPPTRRRPMWPTFAPCSPSRMPGASSRTTRR